MPSTASPDVDAILADLSLADKAAQVVMPWIAGGYQAADDPAALQAQRWVDSLHVGGLIISVGPPTEAAVRLNTLQRRSRLPLLIGSDLESGTSIRLQGGTPFPPQMGLGATGDTLLAEAVGRITAREGRAVGMHFAFAPVADINNNPANPVINVRAFGEDPAQVSAMTRSLVRGIRAEGMLATVKHFPGHGDTGTDSHIALPLVTADPARLDSVELRPFREAIAAGVDAVMSAHIAFPAVTGDSALPGTLSAAVLTDLLRERLGFRGLVITDALDMGAIVSTYGAAEAAVRAFAAGADILLQPKDPEAAVAGLVAAVRSGRISEARLDRSVRAVLAAKARLGLFAQREVPLDSVSAVVGNRAFLEEARSAMARALVLADDAAGAVANLRRGPGRVAVVTYDVEPRPAAAAGIVTALRARGDTVTLVRLHATSGSASLDSARTAIRSAATLVAVVGVRAVSGRGSIAMAEPVAQLLDAAAAAVPTVLVSLGSPYLIAQTPAVRSYLLGWSTTPLAEQAVGRALVGAAAITGRLPVRIPPRYARGAGITLPAHIPSGSLGN
jgi:beta-N-acetylhexosaminidase